MFVADLLALAGAFGDPSGQGALELMADDHGVALFWGSARRTVLAFSDVWDVRNGASRFRSNVQRWRDACEAWLAND